MPEFFIVVPPGLEEDLVQELREIEPFLIGADGRPDLQGLGEIQIDRGGVLIKTEALLALQLHFWLKTAARILLRLESFHAIEFYQLEKNLKRFNLESWIGSEKAHLQVDASKSKLGQEKRIFEVAAKVWGKRLHAANAEGSGPQLFLRAESDEFTLSLDLTGEHLHKRGMNRELAGPAPIRETLAAALLRFLIEGTPLPALQKITLMDPMAGSGTLLSEAANLYRPLSQRTFAFQSQAWIPKILKSPSFLANDRSAPVKIWKGLLAGDSHPLARERLHELATQLPESFTVFDSSPDTSKVMSEKGSIQNPLWVVANPPYGERLEAIPTPDLVVLLTQQSPERVAVILPKKKADELEKAWPKNWQIRKKPVQNGGLPCLFIAFTKTS